MKKNLLSCLLVTTVSFCTSVNAMESEEDSNGTYKSISSSKNDLSFSDILKKKGIYKSFKKVHFKIDEVKDPILYRRIVNALRAFKKQSQ